MEDTQFHHLNTDWNAEPNAPEPRVTVSGGTLQLDFFLNPFAYDAEEEEIARIVFEKCTLWRLGATNDEGWYRGQCRFSQLAPRWGEFYEITGDALLAHDGLAWNKTASSARAARHFLFYFRDDTFECRASDWHLKRER